MAKRTLKYWGEYVDVNSNRLQVIRESSGSNITYTTWDADYGLPRETISFSTRPAKVVNRRAEWDKTEIVYCVRRRSGLVNIDEMFGIRANAYPFISERRFDYGMADSAFSGVMLDSNAYTDCDGEYAYIADSYC